MSGPVLQTTEAPAPLMTAESLWPVYLDDAERAAVLLPDPSRAAFAELLAITRRCFEADDIPVEEALAFVVDLRGFSESVTDLEAISPPPEPLALEVPNAQDAPGREQGNDRRADIPMGATAVPVSFGVIAAAILTEVRDALAVGPLSFRALRVRIGRGWRPARVALQTLVDAGEVSREGERGRSVRFRLVARPDAPAPTPTPSLEQCVTAASGLL